MKWGHVVGLDRIESVYQPPLRAVESVDPFEWCAVYAGWVLVIWSPVFVNNGYLRLDGVVRVGNEHV